MSDLINRIVHHVLDTPIHAFQPEVLHGGRRRILDVMGCAVSGRLVASNAAMGEVFARWGGAGEASVLGSGDRLPVAQAAMMNSLQARSFDFEVCGPEGEGANKGKMVGHVGSTTEVTAISVGEWTHSTGSEVLAAVILGGDVAARLAVSDKFEFNKSFEVCGTANAFGATAVVGRLMKLSHEELRNAFGLIVNMMSGTFQSLWDGVDSFKLPGAMSAYNAIIACELSRGSFRGVQDALQARQGYFAMYANDPAPESMLVDLGSVFYVHGQHKVHPSCYGNHNPIDCALEVRAADGFVLDDIESIVLEVQPNRIDHFLNQPAGQSISQARALFNIPYGIANALVRGRPELGHYTEDGVQDSAVLDVAARVRLEARDFGGKSHVNRLVVTMSGGEVLAASREDPVGWLVNPASDEQLDEKFWRNVDFHGGLDAGRAAHALELLKGLERVGDVAEIADHLSVR